ncbi:transcription factor bHLH148-like [Papaver somniferum]|uniref:transcription factor bHLH148-like n=1 Tax=Papaver somniferum TaxID=3469 RepID=UPI000E6FF768|nr:transcription factor bHLH148-like [Papaver somniferum]
MASSSIISNLGTVSHQDSSIESKKKRRKKNQYQSQNQQQNQTPRWRSSNEHQIYSSKLIEALRHVRRNNNDSNDNSSSSSSNTDQSSNSNTTSSLSTAKNGRAIREAADKALAVAAKGRTRWSRAILTNRLQLKFKKKKPKVVTCRSQKRSFDVYQLKDKKKLQPLQRKVKVLGRIVPGCKKLSFPVLLEETTDYIAALEMQVRTMTALTQLLSLAGSSSSSSPASTNHVEDHSL